MHHSASNIFAQHMRHAQEAYREACWNERRANQQEDFRRQAVMHNLYRAELAASELRRCENYRKYGYPEHEPERNDPPLCPSVSRLMSSVGKGCGSFWDTFCNGCSTVGFMGLGASAILLCTAAFGNVGADRASRLYLAGGLSMAGGVLCCISTGLVHACRDNPDRPAIVSFLTCLLHGGTCAPPIADAPNDDAPPPDDELQVVQV